jgi:hypothetical protein
MHPVKNDNSLFDSLEEFVDTINRGGEIEFEYENRKHSITQPDGKLNYIEFNNESSLAEFGNISELLDYKISGRKIREIVTEIKPFFRSL